MECRYDPALANPDAWDLALRDELRPEDAALVEYLAVPDGARLVEHFETVLCCDWRPKAASIGLTDGIDWVAQVIDVHLNAQPPADVTNALRALGGRRIRVTTGGHAQRRADKPKSEPADPG